MANNIQRQFSRLYRVGQVFSKASAHRSTFAAAAFVLASPLSFAGLNTPTLAVSMDAGAEIGEYTVTQDGGNCAKRVYVAVKEGGCNIRLTEDKNGGCAGNDARKRFYVQMDGANIKACQLRYTTDHNNGLASKPSRDSAKIKVKQYLSLKDIPLDGTTFPMGQDDEEVYTIGYEAKTLSGADTKGSSGNNISYSVSGTLCTLSGNQLTIKPLQGGTCTVSANLSGNDDLTAASTSVSYSISPYAWFDVPTVTLPTDGILNLPYLVVVKEVDSNNNPLSNQPNIAYFSQAQNTCGVVQQTGLITNNAPGLCTIKAVINGSIDTSRSWYVSAMQRSQPYDITSDDQGNNLPNDAILTTETPTICGITNDNKVKIYGGGVGNCIIRATPLSNVSSPIRIHWPVVLDKDGDGIPDAIDNCVNVVNSDQEGSELAYDENGLPFTSPLGAACNFDWDNDGVLNTEDNCPNHYNPDQEIDLSTPAGQAGFGIACADDYDENGDQDGDGIINKYDNCPFVKNGVGSSNFIQVDGNYQFTNKQNRFNASGNYDPNGMWIQKDTDQDGVGDACDSDIDGDGVRNELDNCPYIANTNQLDSLGNGVGDACRQAFVKTDGNNDYDCSTWDLACSSIDEGILEAKNQGLNTVFIAGGEYTLSDSLSLQDGISLSFGHEVGDVTESDAGKKATILTVAGNKPLIKVIDQGTSVNDEITIAGLVLGDHTSNAVDTPALLVKDSLVFLRGGKLHNNSTTVDGTSAAVVVDNAHLNVVGTEFSDNSAKQGAGIYSKNGSTVTLNSALFKNNVTSDKGAAVYQTSGSLILAGSQIENNQSADGAIYASAGEVAINSRTVFKENTATGFGAAIVTAGTAKLNVDRAEFIKNQANSSGGALSLEGSAAKTITASIFEENSATHGGAIYFNSSGALALDNSIFFENKAGEGKSGGAIYMPTSVNGILTARHNTFVKNEAGNGGAIRSESADKFRLIGNLIAGNIASNGANVQLSAAAHPDSAYNLIGSGGQAGINAHTPANTITPDETLDKIVADKLSNKGGDGYQSSMRTLAILGGGPARNMVLANSSGNCSVTTDMRGEKRPDDLSNNSDDGAACDAGAYEFTALSCEEDAARRYAQGELFIKSCDPKFDKIELNLGGSASYYILLMLAMLGGIRLYRRN